MKMILSPTKHKTENGKTKLLINTKRNSIANKSEQTSQFSHWSIVVYIGTGVRST